MEATIVASTYFMEEFKMFNNQRYATKGIIADIPEYLQNMVWYMIESMEVTEKDYLQVFELKTEVVNGKPMQRLIHTQEQPEYKNEIVFAATTPVTTKIYVIDDKTHSTMLKAEEY